MKNGEWHFPCTKKCNKYKIETEIDLWLVVSGIILHLSAGSFSLLESDTWQDITSYGSTAQGGYLFLFAV